MNISAKLYAAIKDYDFLFSVIQAEWFTVAICSFLFSFIFFLLGSILNHYSLLGVSRDSIRKAQPQNKTQDGNVVPLTWYQKANLDNPPKGIYAKRWCARILRLGVLVLFGALAFAYLLLVCVFFIINSGVTEQLLLSAQRFYPGAWLLGSLVLGAVISSLVHFIFLRDGLAEKDAEVNRSIIESRKQHKGRTGTISDARSLEFATVPDFDPVDYFDMAVAKDAVFLGLDEKRSPIYIPRKTWVKSNIQIMGSVGSGKGVLACCALAQCASTFNDAVIVFDPKNDEFAPHVLKSQADNFVLLDLRQGKPPQLNIFKDLNAYQLNELLVSGFSLGRTGSESDFYRNGDREAVRLLSSQFESGTDIGHFMDAAQKLPKEIKDKAGNFLSQLRELSELTVLQTSEGVDLKNVILNGGCLYVLGSLRDESVIMLQKMLFVRCLQIIEERDRFKETTHVNIMLDEFKYLLSKSSLEALGTVRDKNCNILLTHQSLGDFGQCGADMKSDVARATVIDNTPIKWIYRMKDPDVVSWVSKQTGQIRVDSERRSVSTDAGNVELMSTDTTVSKETRELIDTNTIQHLPDGAAVMIGVGLARIAYSKPIKTARQPIALHEYPKLTLPDVNFLSDDEQSPTGAANHNPPDGYDVADDKAKKANKKRDGEDDGWR